VRFGIVAAKYNKFGIMKKKKPVFQVKDRFPFQKGRTTYFSLILERKIFGDKKRKGHN